MARSSSAQKIARLAQKGKGKKVRFQGGSTFATVILSIVLLGSILVAYARQSEPVVDASLTAEQQYALSFGVYFCDQFIDGIAAVPAADAIDPEASTSIAAEGVVLWKPQVLAGERKAKLGTIFDLYGLAVTDSSITFPSAVSVNEGQPVSEDTTECNGEPGSLVVVSWPDAADSANSDRSIASFDGVRLTNDNMAIVLAFIPDGAEVPQPDSAAEVSTVPRQG